MPAKLSQTTVERGADLTKVVQTDAGARVMRWLIYEAGMLEQPVWTADSPLTMAMLEGRRAVAREISNELRKLDERYGTNLSRRVIEARFGAAPAPAKDKEK